MVYSSTFPHVGNTHIFLSYRSSEVEFALKLAADQKNAGVKLRMDRLDISPGDDWRSSLEYAVLDSEAVIAVLRWVSSGSTTTPRAGLSPSVASCRSARTRALR
jgi:hypothetical protein